jgi:uncharacterized SAM-binding protein YcdF (DUF218 family)
MLTRKRWTIFLFALFFLIALAVVLVFFHNQILLAIGDHLIISDDLHQADVIHVISGLDYRTDYAIQLYKEGYGQTLFFTGGWCDVIQGNHALRGEQISLLQGIPVQDIAIDPTDVISTYAEAERLKIWVDEDPQAIKSIIVVSDPFHMRRVRWTYRQVFGKEIEIQLAPVPFEQTQYLRYWWKDAKSLSMVEQEYLKLAFYLIRYKYSWGPMRKWLSKFDRF